MFLIYLLILSSVIAVEYITDKLTRKDNSSGAESRLILTKLKKKGALGSFSEFSNSKIRYIYGRLQYDKR